MSTLAIENIEHTNGTSAITIDTGGIVKTPQRPAFLAKKLGGSNVNSCLLYTSPSPRDNR